MLRLLLHMTPLFKLGKNAPSSRLYFNRNIVIINIQVHDIYITLLEVLSCAVHNLLNHMHWHYIAAISDSLEGLQTNWNNTLVLMLLMSILLMRKKC